MYKTLIALTLSSCLYSSDPQNVAEWINVIHIGSFFDDYYRYILNNTHCFVTFDSFDRFSIWGECYGYYTHYNSSLKRGQKIDFKATAVGLGIGGNASVVEDLYVGGGFGCFHSLINSKIEAYKTPANGPYWGSSAQYRYTDGWVALTLLGVGNFFGHQNKQSWDLNVRVETEYCLTTPADFFITDLTIYPLLKLDYTNVFISGCNSSYFHSKLGSRLEKIMHCSSREIIVLNIDLGWINMTPLTSHPKPESKNQLAIGGDLIGMSYMGWLVALEYQAALGSNAPIQSEKIRFEWNW